MISTVSIRLAGAAIGLGALVVLGLAQSPVGNRFVAAEAMNLPQHSATPVTPAISNEMRGDIMMARKQFRDAIDMYRECPPSAVIDNKIGIAFHQLLLLDEAKKNYELAIKKDPKYAEAINNLGTIYYARHNMGKAIKYYKRALKLDSVSSSIWVNLGSAYFTRHDFKRSSRCFYEALRLDPEVFERQSDYGTMLQERSVEDRARFHMFLARAYARMGDNAKAILYLRKALEEGIRDRKRIPDIPEFASLKKDTAFVELLAENPKPL